MAMTIHSLNSRCQGVRCEIAVQRRARAVTVRQMNAAPATEVNLRFTADPAEFLAVAGEHLAAEPVVSTVVTTMAHADRMASSNREWWLVVHDGTGAVVGAGMRTATFAPYPPFLLPMPDEAAVSLARALHERGEEVRAVNGALPAVELFAAETVRLAGGRVEVSRHTRLHELGELSPPAPVPGALKVATEDDAELVGQWFAAFMGDADEQAGRPRGASAHEVPDRADLLRRLREGRLWFWVDEHGQPVHMTGVMGP